MTDIPCERKAAFGTKDFFHFRQIRAKEKVALSLVSSLELIRNRPHKLSRKFTGVGRGLSSDFLDTILPYFLQRFTLQSDKPGTGKRIITDQFFCPGIKVGAGPKRFTSKVSVVQCLKFPGITAFEQVLDAVAQCRPNSVQPSLNLLKERVIPVSRQRGIIY